jgi:hypothetical protein
LHERSDALYGRATITAEIASASTSRVTDC